MAPFYGWCSTASRLEPLRGGSSPFLPLSRFERGTPGLGIVHIVFQEKIQFLQPR